MAVKKISPRKTLSKVKSSTAKPTAKKTVAKKTAARKPTAKKALSSMDAPPIASGFDD